MKIKLIFNLIFLLIFMIAAAGCQSKDTAKSQTNQPQNDSYLNEDLQKAAAQLGQENLVDKYDQAIIKTNLGDIKVKFYNQESPLTVNNFLNLAQSGFYDGTTFHRVIKDFMIQGGDPLSKNDNWKDDGTGGPDYRFKDEFNSHKLVAGSLAMANAGANTNGSQFFIVTAASTPWLDGKHTNFGYVTEGMDVVKKIEALETNENDHPLENAAINKIELIEISK